MSFLNPFFFIGALALGVPILIHLVRREKAEIIQFSSLMFLLRVPKQAIRQQKIKNLLLMALRLLLLAMLVLAFTRPYSPEPPAAATPEGQAQGLVLMLDTSSSMRYGTNFDRAKSEAIQRIDAMKSGDRAAIIEFNDHATVAASPTADKEALKAVVGGMSPSFRRTSFYDGFVLADRMLGEFGGRARQLVVISDYQKTGWNRSSREALVPVDVKTESIDVGPQSSTNVGIDSVSLQATTFARTYSDRVIARIHNYRADQAVSVPVVLSIADREHERKSVTVQPRSTALAEFTGFDLPLGFTKGRIRIDADDPLKVDNEFLFAIERREKLRVLVLDAGRPRQSYFLQQAYTSTVELPFDLKVMAANAATPDEVAKHEVVVINDASRVSDAVRAKLDQLRKSGQGQLVILGENADLGWWGSYTAFPVKPDKKIFVGKDRGRSSVSITTQERSHPVFQIFEKSAKLSLHTGQIFAYTQADARPGASVIAKFDDGSPAIVETGKADPGMLVLMTSVDNKWSDLPLKPSFVPFFHELVRYLAHYTESRGWYPLGEAVAVVGGQQTATAAAISPKGERTTIGELAPGEQRFFSPAEPGFHEIRSERSSRIVAVNPPTVEGDLEKMPPDELLASVQRTQGETRQAGAATEEDKDAYARRQSAWWYLLIVAFITAIAEVYVANRSYSRAGGAV